MDQADLLRRVLDVLEQKGLTYMVVGSFASAVYGEARLTHDIDIVVDLHFDEVESLCAAFPPPDFYVSVEAARSAITSGGMFNVIHPTSGNKVDFVVARKDAWGRLRLQRRIRKRLLPDREAMVASPEDVILGKLWYYREGESEKHLRDIAAMLQVSGDQIDTDYVHRWAVELGVTEPWHAVLKRLGRES